MRSLNVVKNDLFDYENRYIYQFEKGFKFSLDSILLAEFVENLKSSDKVLDLCSGNAVVPLILTTKYNANYYGFEIQSEVYRLANKSIIYNKLDRKIKIINDDLKNYNKYFSNNSFNVITCNPPYFKYSNSNILNGDKITSISRHEIEICLEDIYHVSSKLLSNNGVFYLVHRADRLDEIVMFANKYKMNVKNIIFIQCSDKLVFNTVLVKCVKNSKLGVKVNYVNINNLSSYKNIFKEYR